MHTSAVVKILPDIHGERHDDAIGKRQHHPKQPVLDRGESRKLVKDNHTVPDELGFLRHLTQECQNLLRRDVFPINILPESLIHRKNILHLTAQGIPDILPTEKSTKILRRDIVLRHLRDQGLDLTDVSHFVEIAAKHREFFFLKLRHLAQHQILARLL